MKRLAVLITIAVLLAGLILLGSSDTVIFIADADVPNNKVTGTEANNSSATVGIRITMTEVLKE